MFVQPATEVLPSFGGDLPNMLPSVLLRGNDAMLLLTRKLILERAGLSVSSVLGAQKSDDDATILILCFTLSTVEKAEAVRRYRIRVPWGRILILGDSVSNPICDGCEVLMYYPGPEVFVKTVCQLAAVALSK